MVQEGCGYEPAIWFCKDNTFIDKFGRYPDIHYLIAWWEANDQELATLKDEFCALQKQRDEALVAYEQLQGGNIARDRNWKYVYEIKQ